MPGRRAIRRCRSLLVGVIAVLCYLTVGFTAMRLLLGGLVLKVLAAQAVGPADLVRDVDGRGAGPPREVLTAAMGYASDATPLWYAVQMTHQPWLRLRSRNVLVEAASFVRQFVGTNGVLASSFVGVVGPPSPGLLSWAGLRGQVQATLAIARRSITSTTLPRM